jgi:hypothetical protein
MKKYLAIIAFAAVSPSAFAQFFTNEAAFVAALNGPFYKEQFTGWTFGNPLNGSQLTWSAPGGNGYGWDAAAASGLWSNIDALSTSSADEPITFTFTGLPVTAFGGVLSNTDIAGNNITGDVTLSLSNGATQTVSLPNGGSTFLGYISPVTLTGASIVAVNATAFDWVQGDDIYTGSAVPEPGTMIALGLGAAALAARRRRKLA